MNKHFITFICFISLSGCGDSGTGSGQYSTSPAMISLNAVSAGGNSINLVATATDDTGIAGYCFSKSPTPPLASDSCFQTSNSQNITASSALGKYYVWAKDAFDHVTPNSLSGPCSTAGYAASDLSKLSTVCMMTSLGELVFELNSTQAPITTANFLKYINSGFYTNLVFHRIMNTFMIQGGGYTYSTTSGLTAKTAAYPAIALEPTTITGLSNTAETLAMARGTSPDSATSGFFINTVNNPNWNGAGGYAVFGKVISGTNVLNELKNVSVVNNGSGEISLPVKPPVIQWAYQIK